MINPDVADRYTILVSFHCIFESPKIERGRLFGPYSSVYLHRFDVISLGISPVSLDAKPLSDGSGPGVVGGSPLNAISNLSFF